ncbi:hypothetical protein CDAR_424051 [Caerostris darwini]|uniref:Uncharacterized protein n=1 Tax=Caerostris darwini TaxID=1538125 RepID=A0AAV4T868_9ARAC|nr:hypothetical protein CDAR_424051 [Caerostris darwini]
MKPAYQHLRDVIKDPCEWRRNRSGQLFRDPINSPSASEFNCWTSGGVQRILVIRSSRDFNGCIYSVDVGNKNDDGRRAICNKSPAATSTIIIPNNGGCPMKPAYQHLRDVIKDPREWRRNRSGQLFRDPINSPFAFGVKLFDKWWVQRGKKRNTIVGGRAAFEGGLK